MGKNEDKIQDLCEQIQDSVQHKGVGGLHLITGNPTAAKPSIEAIGEWFEANKFEQHKTAVAYEKVSEYKGEARIRMDRALAMAMENLRIRFEIPLASVERENISTASRTTCMYVTGNRAKLLNGLIQGAVIILDCNNLEEFVHFFDVLADGEEETPVQATERVRIAEGITEGLEDIRKIFKHTVQKSEYRLHIILVATDPGYQRGRSEKLLEYILAHLLGEENSSGKSVPLDVENDYNTIVLE